MVFFIVGVQVLFFQGDYDQFQFNVQWRIDVVECDCKGKLNFGENFYVYCYQFYVRLVCFLRKWLILWLNLVIFWGIYIKNSGKIVCLVRVFLGVCGIFYLFFCWCCSLWLIIFLIWLRWLCFLKKVCIKQSLKKNSKKEKGKKVRKISFNWAMLVLR